MKADSTIIVEVDGPRNQNLLFGPLQRRIRGRFDITRVAEPLAKMKQNEWGTEAIPGQRLAIDTETGKAWLEEPIHRSAKLKAIVERKGYTLPPEREDFGVVDAPTWMHWFKRAVKSGVARVVQGTLPERIDGTPRTNFYTARSETQNDKLAAALDRQTEMFGKLIELLAAKK